MRSHRSAAGALSPCKRICVYSTAQAKRRLIARVIITRTASNSPSADHICRGWPCGSSEAPCCVVFSLQRRAQRVRPGVGPPVGRRRARFEAADHPHRRDRWARTCVRRLVQVTLAGACCMLHVPCCLLRDWPTPAKRRQACRRPNLRPSIPRGLGLPVESNRPFQPVSQSARENSCDAFARMVPAPSTFRAYSSADMTLHARPGTPRGVCVDKCAAPRPISRND